MNAKFFIFVAFLCQFGWAAHCDSTDETSLLQVKQIVKRADGSSSWADGLSGDVEQEEEDDTSRRGGLLASFQTAFRQRTSRKLKAVESYTDVKALKTARDAQRRHDKTVNRNMRRLEDAQDKAQGEREKKDQNWLARMYGVSLGREQAQLTNAHRTNKVHRKWDRADIARNHKQENQVHRRKAREIRQYLRQKQRAERESENERNKNYGKARRKMSAESGAITRQMQADILDSETFYLGKAQGKTRRGKKGH